MDRRTSLKQLLALSLPSCGCVFGCRSAPYTGRSQLIFVPEQQEIAMGQTAFADVLAKEPISQNMRFQQIVERVGMRIAGVSGRTDYQWETKVIASQAQNAFCLPGGKIVVYEGILPICQNEAGLAVVMSHEVAHVLARHGGERMSQSAAVNGAQTVVGMVMRNQEQVNRDIVMRAYGLGSQYGLILPYSRKHELEADQIGLTLMAQAGYDPSEGPRFWKRFVQLPRATSRRNLCRLIHQMNDGLPIWNGNCLKRLQAYTGAINPVGLGETIV